eukprot:c26324_g1_i3 orf=701-979(-)
MLKTLCVTYFCCIVAHFCCILSGCTRSVAFRYAFFTEGPSINSIRGMGCHPLSGQSTCHNRIPQIKFSHVKINIQSNLVIVSPNHTREYGLA